MASTSGSSAARATKLDDGVERLVGVVEEHVALVEEREDSSAPRSSSVATG